MVDTVKEAALLEQLFKEYVVQQETLELARLAKTYAIAKLQEAELKLIELEKALTRSVKDGKESIFLISSEDHRKIRIGRVTTKGITFVVPENANDYSLVSNADQLK